MVDLYTWVFWSLVWLVHLWKHTSTQASTASAASTINYSISIHLVSPYQLLPVHPRTKTYQNCWTLKRFWGIWARMRSPNVKHIIWNGLHIYSSANSKTPAKCSKMLQAKLETVRPLLWPPLSADLPQCRKAPDSYRLMPTPRKGDEQWWSICWQQPSIIFAEFFLTSHCLYVQYHKTQVVCNLVCSIYWNSFAVDEDVQLQDW